MAKVDKFLPVSRPTISEETIEDVVNVLRSGWLATGPITKQFEEKLSEYFSGRKVLCFSSATAGLHAALMAMGVGNGDEVITPSMTFVATANVVATLGAKPVFVDIDRNTFNMDPQRIWDACTPRTKVILPVHYAGLPVDLDAIYEIARLKKFRVLEDAAHAMGAAYRGKRIGSFGDIQAFSFHPIKNMTSAEGGCLVLDSESEERFLNLQRFHGIDRSIWDRFSKTASCYYDVVCPGSKSNMSDLQSIIGVHQLRELESMNIRRRELADRYRAALADLQDHIFFQQSPSYDSVHSGHLFPTCIRDDARRDDFIDFLKKNNIGTTPYYMPVHLFSYYRDAFGYKDGDLEHTEYIGRRIVCIPLYPTLENQEQDYIIRTIGKFFE
ncbi:MAG: DegT/DnrJ/EryC1/StrS aminotransferase family protein [Holosporaceae bacterium]|nr:DegT/DnrJ/EryC1/StrS aminotransferase family protein [Holosporaceae bacterium]